MWTNKKVFQLLKVQIIGVRITEVFNRSFLGNFKGTMDFVGISESSNYTSSNYTELTVVRNRCYLE